MSDSLPRTIDVVLQGLDQGLHLGAALYVSLRGVEISHLVFAEAEPGRLLTHSASCPWLSAGKPLTAAAVAWLWERKLLKLDDPVAKYWPAFAANGKHAITLRHCLTHQAGLRLAISAWTRQSEDEIRHTLENAAPEPGWVVGQSAGYHVAATWFVLGEVCRVVSTKPFGQFIRDHLFVPLGMTGTHLTFTPEQWAQIAGSRMVMHDTSRRFVTPTPPAATLPAGSPFTSPPDPAPPSPLSATTLSTPTPPTPLSWESADIWQTPRPGSGVRGPVADLGRFYEFMLGHYEPPTSVLSVTTRAAMSARHRVGVFDQTFRAKVDWGLGVVCDSQHYGQGLVPYQFGRHASPRAFGHGGNQSSVGFADPEHGLAAAFVWNGMPGDPRHDKRLRDTLEALYADLDLVPSSLPISSAAPNA